MCVSDAWGICYSVVDTPALFLYFTISYTVITLTLGFSSSNSNLNTAKYMRANSPKRGFTLLELLAVVAILSVISGAVIFGLSGIRRDAVNKTAEGEIASIASAIAAFKRDTGYFPKQGPFDLVANDGVIDPNNDDHWPEFLSSASASNRTAWFNHPSNFYQLTLRSSPLANTGHKLASIDISSGRGWNGPYIKDAGHFVRAGTYTPATHAHTPATWTDGKWDPTSGVIIQQIPAVFDPNVQTVGTFIVELTTGSLPARWGRPYCYFLSNNTCWVVGMGQNGIYEGGVHDGTAGGKDDVVHYVSK